MTKTEKLVNYISEKFGIEGDHPFKEYPDYTAFRHDDNGKWFALYMPVTGSQLKLKDKSGTFNILNVKNQPEVIDMLKNTDGFLPAYHMNKEQWISILIDDSANSLEKIENLLKESFSLTSKRR